MMVSIRNDVRIYKNGSLNLISTITVVGGIPFGTGFKRMGELTRSICQPINLPSRTAIRNVEAIISSTTTTTDTLTHKNTFILYNSKQRILDPNLGGDLAETNCTELD